MNLNILRFGTILVVLLLLSCKSTTAPNHLLGTWEVRNIYREGKSIVGPGFHGAHYEFRSDGIVLAWELKGDTLEAQYTRKDDSLFWVTMDQNIFYLIDTLNADLLRLNLDQEGIKSQVEMKKVHVQ